MRQRNVHNVFRRRRRKSSGNRTATMTVTDVAPRMNDFRGRVCRCICVAVVVTAMFYASFWSNNSVISQNEFKTESSNCLTTMDDNESCRGRDDGESSNNLPLSERGATNSCKAIKPATISNGSREIDAAAFSPASDQDSTEEEYTKLGLEFQPPCSLIRNDAAMSALRRMTTMQCKRELVDLACLDQSGQLYPERLPRYCPAQGGSTGEYLGCYLDNFEKRILDEKYVFSDNTLQRCLDQCLQFGFTMSGVQYGVECFCGYSTPNSTFLLAETACNMTCSGDANQTCGGNLTMNVYHTGVSTWRPTPKRGHELTSGPRVKVLYLFTLSGRSVRQVRRLIKALYHSTETYFFIHVDSREDYLFRELLPLEARFPNFRLSRWRRSTVWCGTTLLDALFHCMEEVLAMADWHWDYLMNLSESEFPIKTHEKLITFLTANNGTNFIDQRGEDIQSHIDMQGIRYTFHECENRVWKVGARNIPLGIQIDGGSDWFTLSRSFVHFAVHNISELVTGLKALFKHTLLPAESFFQTLILNSQFCRTCAINSLRFINWKRNTRSIGACFHRNIIDWCGTSPFTFRPEDWKSIRATSAYDAFLGRKFQPIINQAIINHVEAWLYGAHPDDLPGYTSYWENEFHWADGNPPVDSAFYTVYQSLSRLSVKLMNSTTPDKCNLVVNRVLETTLFTDEDVFKGTLILFEVSDVESEGKVVLETRSMPKHFYEVFDAIAPAGRLKSMEVGTGYAYTDQVFRNLGRIFSAHSRLGLQHKWSDGNLLNATFVWVDPTNTVAGVTEVTIPAGVNTGFDELSVARPLCLGVWTVKLLVHDWTTVAETQFLVVPLSHNGTLMIKDVHEAELLNGGELTDKIRYSHDVDFASVEKGLGFNDDADRSRRLSEVRRNGKLIGAELLDWIDGLVTRFYDIQDTCHVTTPLSWSSSCIFAASNPCGLVSWSSRSPDPKSVVGNVNRFTGRLESM